MEAVGLFHQSVSPREHRHSLGKDYDAKLVPNNLFYKREFKIGEKHKRKRDVEEWRREERKDQLFAQANPTPVSEALWKFIAILD